MDDIAWENDRIAFRIYGPALQHNPKEHSGSGIDVWVKSVRKLVVNDWYHSKDYHHDHGTGLDMYEVGLSRGAGGLGVWDAGKLWNSKDWVTYKMLDKGLDECGFELHVRSVGRQWPKSLGNPDHDAQSRLKPQSHRKHDS